MNPSNRKRKYENIPQELEEAYYKAALPTNPKFDATMRAHHLEYLKFLVMKAGRGRMLVLTDECEWTANHRLARLFPSELSAQHAQRTYGGMVVRV